MGQAFLCGNGGGNPLSFKVVGGETQPITTKENTIWIQTSQPITSWAFSPTEPESYENGTVWISVGESSVVTFNALKKNVLKVKPVAAKQCIDGQWVSLVAKIYQSGEWVQFSDKFAATIKVTFPSGSALTCSDGVITLTATAAEGEYTFSVPNSGTWTVTSKSDSQSKSQEVAVTENGKEYSVTLAYTTYYYNKGDKCTAVTGGWSAGTASGGYTAGKPSIGSDKITCAANGSYIVTTAVTEKAVDLTNVSKLHVVSPGGSTAQNGYYGYFCVTKSRDGLAARAKEVMIPKGSNVSVTLDVSNLTGNYYLMLRMVGGATGSDQVDMNVCYGT